MNIEQQLKKLGLKRYKNKVGKSIGGFLYLHKNYVDQFPEYTEIVGQAETYLPKSFRWNCLKINQKTFAVTFINSPDFDSAHEPVSLDNYTVDVHGGIKYYKPPTSPLIWHHKWLWVMDDYRGFDVEESKERSVFWNEQLEGHPDPRIKSKIGQQKVWNELPFNKKIVKSAVKQTGRKTPSYLGDAGYRISTKEKPNFDAKPHIEWSLIDAVLMGFTRVKETASSRTDRILHRILAAESS